MVVLLNILVPVIIIGLLYLAYKLKKGWPVLVAIAFVLAYGLVQPSYMPKGTVKPVQYTEFQKVDKPMADRMLKPKSGAERDAARKAEFEKNDQRVEALIETMKKEKEQK